jgi:hypothetical protein
MVTMFLHHAFEGFYSDAHIVSKSLSSNLSPAACHFVERQWVSHGRLYKINYPRSYNLFFPVFQPLCQVGVNVCRM